MEVTGKGAKKAELSMHAGDALVCGKGPDETRSKAPLSPPPSHADTLRLSGREPGGLWEGRCQVGGLEKAVNTPHAWCGNVLSCA